MSVILETPRLILRPPQADERADWYNFSADAEAQRYIGGAKDPVMAWRSMALISGGWMVNGYSMFSVIEKATGRWIGRLGPWEPEGWPGHEVGWALVRDTWGKGYATEGAAAAIDWAFDNLGWDEVIHCIDPANTPSQAVARRLGSRILRRAKLPEPFNLELDLWGQSRAEWRARRQG